MPNPASSNTQTAAATQADRERDENLLWAAWEYHSDAETDPGAFHRTYRPIYDMMQQSTKSTAKKLKRKLDKVKKTNEKKWWDNYISLGKQNNLFADKLKERPPDKQMLRGLLDTILSQTSEVVESIETRLSHGENGVLLDVSNNQESMHFEGGTIFWIWRDSKIYSCLSRILAVQAGLISDANLPNIFAEVKATLHISPNRESGSLIPREFDAFALANFGTALRSINAKPIATMTFYRASAAAFRLRMYSGKSGADSADQFTHGTAMVCKILVDHKMTCRAQRPFFSAKRLDWIEEELKILSYSARCQICSNCGKTAPQADLKKCAGCRRCWYCTVECQEKAWKQHKHHCGAKWRRKPIFTHFLREKVEQLFESFELSIGFVAESFCIRDERKHSGLGAGAVVFVKDPTTGEFFDGLTDCPIVFKGKNDSAKTHQVKAASGKNPVASDEGSGGQPSIRESVSFSATMMGWMDHRNNVFG